LGDLLLYFLGYIAMGLILIGGLTVLLLQLQTHSKYKMQVKSEKVPPEFRSRAVITFSMVLPFAALSFLLLTFNSMNIAESLHAEGHYRFVVEALFVPTICFLVGFFYFRRMVR
jgi:hypothetical protein